MPQMNDTIEAKPRQPSKKSGAHKARKASLLPATAYGPATKPLYITIDPRKFALQRQQFGTSHLFDVALDGAKPFKALIREIQQNPVTQELLHVDFYALDMAKPIRIEVPLELEGKAAGIIDGGILTQILRRIEIEVLPTAIPNKVTVDVSPLTIGMSVKASEVKLPAGVKLLTKADHAVATMVAPAEEEAAPTAGVEGAEGAAPAEGAAAATAEGAAGAEGAKGGDKAAPAAAGAKGGKEGKK